MLPSLAPAVGVHLPTMGGRTHFPAWGLSFGVASLPPTRLAAGSYAASANHVSCCRSCLPLALRPCHDQPLLLTTCLQFCSLSAVWVTGAPSQDNLN